MKKYFIVFVLILTLGVACGGPETLTDSTANTSVASEAGLCENLTDDDGDGAIDCDDSDCQSEAICLGSTAVITDVSGITSVVTTETNCSDGLDDDGDGTIDCQDLDCKLNATTEISGDGTDQNCDGFDFAVTDENVNWVDPVLGADKDADGVVNAACSVDLPCRTIEHTLSGISGGDTIAVMHGHYAPRTNLYLSQGVGLFGGFFRDDAGQILRHFDQKKSVIHLDEKVKIILAPQDVSDTAAVRLNGFTILGQYASPPATSGRDPVGKIQVIHPEAHLTHLTVVVDSLDATAEAAAYAITVEAKDPWEVMNFNLVDSFVRIGEFASTATQIISRPLSLVNTAATVFYANLSKNTMSCGKMSETAITVDCQVITNDSDSANPIYLKLNKNRI